MKKLPTRKLISMIAVALAPLVGACGSESESDALSADVEVTGAATAGASQTGQGIMVNFKPAGSFAVEETQRWRFDEAAAAAYFGNAWDGHAPAVSCSGAACNGNVCGVPVTPSAPAPDAAKVADPGRANVVGTSMCTMLDGGSLTATDSYTQTVTVDVSCSVIVNNKTQSRAGRYTFRYTYGIAPLSADPVAPFTAWNLISTTGDGTAHVELNADIAGESVLVKGGVKKYSFSLDTNGVSRVSDLVVSVDGTATPATSTLNYPVDFQYQTNAGSNGHVEYLVDGDARTILNTDGFAGNNNGGSDGAALALASMSTVGADLAAGDHTVVLTGTVKGNSASADVGFAVTQIVHVVTPGCGTQQQ